MSRQRQAISRVLALLLCVVVLAAACGGGEEEGATSGGDKVAKIGAIAPISGELSAFGTGIRNSVDLAIRQANEDDRIPGWRLELAAEDDAAKADVGAQAASKLASDGDVVAVIGTYNSSVAEQVIPILDREDIVQVSPGNTNDTLTRGDKFDTDPVRPHDNYFRLATLDSLQGGFAADYALGTLGAQEVVVIHDKKTYGQGIADSFSSRFEANGGTVLGVETVNPGDKDFSAVLSKIKPLDPDMIFYGGEFPEASLVTSQAKQQGIAVPLMGGDGIVDPTYVEVAGEAADGDLGTSVGAPPEQLATAESFIADYEEAGFSEPYSAYGALAYDSANLVIGVLADVLADASSIDQETRRAVIDAVGEADFEGVSGRVAFDDFGDTVTKLLTMNKVVEGAFRPEKTEVVE